MFKASRFFSRIYSIPTLQRELHLSLDRRALLGKHFDCGPALAALARKPNFHAKCRN